MHLIWNHEGDDGLGCAKGRREKLPTISNYLQSVLPSGNMVPPGTSQPPLITHANAAEPDRIMQVCPISVACSKYYVSAPGWDFCGDNRQPDYSPSESSCV